MKVCNNPSLIILSFIFNDIFSVSRVSLRRHQLGCHPRQTCKCSLQLMSVKPLLSLYPLRLPSNPRISLLLAVSVVNAVKELQKLEIRSRGFAKHSCCPSTKLLNSFLPFSMFLNYSLFSSFSSSRCISCVCNTTVC